MCKGAINGGICTPFMVYRSIYSLVMFMYSKWEDLIVASFSDDHIYTIWNRF